MDWMSSVSTCNKSASSNPVVIAEVIRGQHVEGRHFGHVVVVDAAGELLFAAGNLERPTFPRSALKPFQALAGVAKGTDRDFQFTGAELAVTCASHRAEPRHLAAVRSILRKIGATEDDLHCGPHPVLDIATRDELIRAGQEPTAVYNNCSGKHAGMLALARVLGASIDGYWSTDHPVQQQIQRVCNELFDVRGRVAWAVDGCAVPTYLFTLRQLARGFARLSTPGKSLHEPNALACHRVTKAMIAEPDMVGGIDARDSLLMRDMPGALIAKAGAEGVQGIGLIGRGIGVAIKIEDGADRPLWPICMSVLERLDILPEPVPPDLRKAWQAEIKNTRGDMVGFVRACI
jgi:L-asparaginase II